MSNAQIAPDAVTAPLIHPVELVPITELSAYARNYKNHPPDQLREIKASLMEHGFYKNVVIAQDNTLLTGHGVVQACRELGLSHVPCVRLPYASADEARAKRVLIGDNEIEHLSEDDDRLLAELLRETLQEDGGTAEALAGTGYDPMMLANLLMVSRPSSEVADHNEAAHWVGLPEYASQEKPSVQMVISFRTPEDRDRFISELGLHNHGKAAWWPPREREDRSSYRFEPGQDAADDADQNELDPDDGAGGGA